MSSVSCSFVRVKKLDFILFKKILKKILFLMINILSVIKGVCLQFNSPAWDCFDFCLRMRIMEIFIFQVFPPRFLASLATFAGDVFLEAACAIPQIGLCCL